MQEDARVCRPAHLPLCCVVRVGTRACIPLPQRCPSPAPLAPLLAQVVVAESYGGRDEPLDSLVSGLVSAGVEPLLDLRVKEEPTEGVYQVRGGGGRGARQGAQGEARGLDVATANRRGRSSRSAGAGGGRAGSWLAGRATMAARRGCAPPPATTFSPPGPTPLHLPRPPVHRPTPAAV